jgi:hypothetical protein
MNRHDVLENEIVWDEAGHLSEVAKFALADGQDAILPAEALSHFARCQPCAESVGEAALLSAEMSAALSFERAAEHARERSVPWIPIAAALVVAFVSAIPMLSVARQWLSASVFMFGHALRMFGHGIVHLAARGFTPTLYVACTLFLLAMGSTVARLVPRASVQMSRGKV